MQAQVERVQAEPAPNSSNRPGILRKFHPVNLNQHANLKGNLKKRANTWQGSSAKRGKVRVPATNPTKAKRIPLNEIKLSGQELGRGSCTVVYLASVNGMNSTQYQGAQVALMEVRDSETFTNEVEAMRILDHPNVIHFYGYVKSPSSLVMGYCDRSLEAYLKVDLL